MPGAFLTDDLATFLNPDEFGEAAGSITFKGSPINAIFDDADVDAIDGEGVVFRDHQSKLTGRTSDFPSIAKGDAVVVNSVNYTVQHWMDDGTGAIEVFLEKV